MRVFVTHAFLRELEKLSKKNNEAPIAYGKAIVVLEKDPYNRSRTHNMKKLSNIKPGEGEWRLRIGKFRIRYDISGTKSTYT